MCPGGNGTGTTAWRFDAAANRRRGAAMSSLPDVIDCSVALRAVSVERDAGDGFPYRRRDHARHRCAVSRDHDAVAVGDVEHPPDELVGEGIDRHHNSAGADPGVVIAGSADCLRLSFASVQRCS